MSRIVALVALGAVVGLGIGHVLSRVMIGAGPGCLTLFTGESHLVGLAITLLLGLGVRRAQAVVTLKIPPPADVPPEMWNEIRTMKGEHGSWLLGHLERILFFAALWGRFEVLIAAWLAFKLASQWAAWQHIVKLPQGGDGTPISKTWLDIRSRLAWSSESLSRFLIGSLYSLVAAIAGFGAARALITVGAGIVCHGP